jgi:cytidyltransferase-like protein
MKKKDNTPYAERQRESKRKYSKENREVANLWRRLNSKKVQGWNRRRYMQKKGVVGFHSDTEWEELKNSFGFRCAECGISEDELLIRWEGTQFTKLTRDHILPISKGGTDFIQNIRPLCISCNSSKYDSYSGILVAVSGGMDCLHVGHVRLIQAAAEYGDVVVILNNNNWLLTKKGFVFMDEKERAFIISQVRGVKGVIITSHEPNCKDMSVAKELRKLKPGIFCNGGDRKEGCIPSIEEEVCKELGIEMVFGCGGEKIQSSSKLVEQVSGSRLILEEK